MTEKKEKQQELCDCIFCNSKCPECGATEVQVDIQPHYAYDNYTEDRIRIDLDYTHIHLNCKACNYAGDPLDGLYAAIDKELTGVIELDYERDGDEQFINKNHYTEVVTY